MKENSELNWHLFEYRQSRNVFHELELYVIFTSFEFLNVIIIKADSFLSVLIRTEIKNEFYKNVVEYKTFFKKYKNVEFIQGNIDEVTSSSGKIITSFKYIYIIN